jgi:hypothetical protein
MYTVVPCSSDWRLANAVCTARRASCSEMLTHRFLAMDAPQVYERIKDGDRSMLGVMLEW